VENAVARLEDPHVRWLTLTGPGGVGKTALAAAVASQLATHIHDAVTWVGLAHVRDPALVLPTVAQAMGIPESPETPVASRLTTAVSDRRVLLVVDNLEQVADSAPLLAGLLTKCPNLKILATSRVRLRVRAEQVVVVPPLDLPPEEPQEPGIDALVANPAVALFVARTVGVRPDFALEPANANAVAGICRRLDGLPLAIELAAARSALLNPDTLLGQLNNRLGLLTQGFQDAPDRQRTMRDAIAWSHDLLSPDAKVVFRRLAVFSGGLDLGALTGVAHIVESPLSFHAW
jgi:predicted ATPase